MTLTKFRYGVDRLTTSRALEIAYGNLDGVLCDESIGRITASARAVQDIVEDQRVVYGINTGFGPLCNTIISSDDTQRLQNNIIRSHAAGVGKPISPLLSKLMLISKVHSLSKGYSGISLETLRRIIWHIDHDVIPVVPKQGSVGASGDLAPLAHLFLPLLGLGKVWDGDQIVESRKFMLAKGIKPIQLGPKEGLALINGTQFIVAHAIMVVERLHNCLNTADIVGAMMIEALMGSQQPFSQELHELRPFTGNQHVAARIYKLLENSEILDAHIECNRVQDPYSLRCIPQVHGSSRSAWLHLKDSLEIELNSVTDNPIIMNRDWAISGGNFHGQPLALPLDYTAFAASELGNISDRRIYLALEGNVEGLPTLLMQDTGINSGFMLCQYTSAALVSENKCLVFPASADSIPTSLGQEDHVSMGSISGRKTLKIIDNLEKILAIELLCAAQAFDFRHPLKSGPILEACHAHIRSKIDHADEDRVFARDIEKSLDIIRNQELLKIVKSFEHEHANIRTAYHDLFEVY